MTIKYIIIPFENLTQGEQVELFLDLQRFAFDKLPKKKRLDIIVKQKHKRKPGVLRTW